MVFAIGLGTNVDQDVLQQMADLSGGRAFFPSDVSQLPAEYRRVVDDLRRRYVLGYTSTHIQRDGSWREGEIRSRVTRTPRFERSADISHRRNSLRQGRNRVSRAQCSSCTERPKHPGKILPDSSGKGAS